MHCIYSAGGTNYATATHQTNVHFKNNIGAECTDKFDELSIMNYEYISYICDHVKLYLTIKIILNITRLYLLNLGKILNNNTVIPCGPHFLFERS